MNVVGKQIITWDVVAGAGGCKRFEVKQPHIPLLCHLAQDLQRLGQRSQRANVLVASPAQVMGRLFYLSQPQKHLPLAEKQIGVAVVDGQGLVELLTGLRELIVARERSAVVVGGSPDAELLAGQPGAILTLERCEVAEVEYRRHEKETSPAP